MLSLAHTAGVNTGMQIQVHLQGPQSFTQCLLLLFKGFDIRKTTFFFQYILSLNTNELFKNITSLLPGF